MDALIESLKSPDEATRMYAVQDIAEKKDPLFSDVLLARLKVETSPVVRDSLVFHLQKLDCTKVLPRLFEMFVSPDAFLRNSAVMIFGSQGDDAIAFLTSALDHADREVRKLILDALFACGTQEARLAIRAGLHDPSINVKITAVEYLGRLEDRESAGEMIDLLSQDIDPMLRTAVLESLPLVADARDIAKAIAILIPGDVHQIDPLFIPEILNLAGRAAGPETIYRLIESVADNATYAGDFLRTLTETESRYPGFMARPKLLEKIVGLLENPEIDEAARYTACELVLKAGRLSPMQIETLGLALSEDPAMIYAALRLLEAAGTPTAKERMAIVRAGAKDEQLRFLDEEEPTE